ncbi:MAG: hypothetical protein ACO1QB_00255 [Verrucomicrobiales bacterium]
MEFSKIFLKFNEFAFNRLFPKRTTKRPEWLKAPNVDEVCSASCCISTAPEGWIDQWLHNEMWVYDSPALAGGVLSSSEKNEFDLYAYKMFPSKFAEGKEIPFALPLLPVTPLPKSFQLLGYDSVSRSYDNVFECSPLSCNHIAERVLVNRYCLLEDFQTAKRLAAEFSIGGAEPGPYFVVEVWRQQRPIL